MQTSNFSYWERTAFIGEADVIIIGSGIVGLNAALHLKRTESKLKVLVLEQGFLPSGASTKNAGFACFGTVSEQLEALKTCSPEELAALVNYKWRGLQRMRQNLGDHAIDYHQHGGYELFMNNEYLQAEKAFDSIPLLNEILRGEIEGHDIYSVADAKIAGFGFAGVKHIIYNPYEGQIHTGKMMRALLAKVYQQDVIVLNNCSVTGIEQDGDAVTLRTSAGSFKANKVIVATNAFARKLYPDLDVKPGRGQVLITKPIEGLKLKGTYHFNEGYYYFRNIDNRVLFGGGRNLDFKAEQTTYFGHTEIVQEKLTQYLRETILPDTVFKIDYWWSGVMGFGEQLKPIVKELEQNIYCAVRCNGMGVAMGTLVGEEVAGLLLRS